MNSKEILPESERQKIRSKIEYRQKYSDLDFVYSALLAAESELNEKDKQFADLFKVQDDELRSRVITIQNLEKEIKEYKKLANNKEFKELGRRLKERKFTL